MGGMVPPKPGQTPHIGNIPFSETMRKQMQRDIAQRAAKYSTSPTPEEEAAALLERKKRMERHRTYLTGSTGALATTSGKKTLLG